MRAPRTRPRFAAHLAAALLLAALRAGAQDWHVPEALVRFELSLARGPTHPEAGYFATVPDGGLLPRPFPLTTVVGEDGKKVDSFLLWHNEDAGASLVFADPGKVKKVFVYVTGSGSPRLWTPATPLRPSAILAADPTSGGMAAAKKLGQLGHVGPTVTAINKAGIPKAPLSIGGNESGRPRPGAFYLLAHLVVKDPGKTWISPFVQDGQCEVVVNGKPLRLEKRIDKWGGTGEYVDLPAGLHRLEVFQVAGGSGPYSSDGNRGGLMYLTWRTPNASMDELGGVRSDKVPMAGSSRMETRVLRDNEIARSGECRLESARTRDGRPAAIAQVIPTHNFWFENEPPVLVCRCEALETGNPKETRYEWALPGGLRGEGAKLQWLFHGFRENQARLTATGPAGRTQGALPFFGFTTARTSLENGGHREAYRTAFLNVARAGAALPPAQGRIDPVYWNNLFRVLRWGEGQDFLTELFKIMGNNLPGQIDGDRLAFLQDSFLDIAPARDAKDALAWLHRFDQGALGKPARKAELAVREAEIHLFYLGDTNAAMRALGPAALDTGDSAIRRVIRLGDVALMSGNLNAATKHYADAQNSARRQRTLAAAAKPGSSDLADWKRNALLDVSASENVAQLIESGHLQEARDALAEWERTFPISKISGDYLLQDAALHMKVGDWRRASALLKPYCEYVDASAFLPDAARALLACMRELKAPRQEIVATATKLRKRLEFHPVAAELDAILQNP